jgi:phytoene synthase
MDDPFAYCEQLVREADKDLFLATLFAPANRRRALFALYAFAIEIARVPDRVREPLAGEIRLQWWRDTLEGTSPEARGHATAAALLDTVVRFGLPRQRLIAMIDGRNLDLCDAPPATLAELETYAASISPLPLATALLRPSSSGPQILAASLAVEVTTLLRRFPADVARGRLHLPLDLLQRHGVEPDDVLAGRSSDGLRAALAEMRALARACFDEFAKMAPLPPAVAPAFLPVMLVPLYLDRLARSSDPFAIVEVPQWRRQWRLWRTARRYSAASA